MSLASWVLIIITSVHGGYVVDTQEFKSNRECQTAEKWIKNEIHLVASACVLQ